MRQGLAVCWSSDRDEILIPFSCCFSSFRSLPFSSLLFPNLSPLFPIFTSCLPFSSLVFQTFLFSWHFFFSSLTSFLFTFIFFLFSAFSFFILKILFHIVSSVPCSFHFYFSIPPLSWVFLDRLLPFSMPWVCPSYYYGLTRNESAKVWRMTNHPRNSNASNTWPQACRWHAAAGTVCWKYSLHLTRDSRNGGLLFHRGWNLGNRNKHRKNIEDKVHMCYPSVVFGLAHHRKQIHLQIVKSRVTHRGHTTGDSDKKKNRFVRQWTEVKIVRYGHAISQIANALSWGWTRLPHIMAGNFVCIFICKNISMLLPRFPRFIHPQNKINPQVVKVLCQLWPTCSERGYIYIVVKE